MPRGRNWRFNNRLIFSFLPQLEYWNRSSSEYNSAFRCCFYVFIRIYIVRPCRSITASIGNAYISIKAVLMYYIKQERSTNKSINEEKMRLQCVTCCPGILFYYFSSPIQISAILHPKRIHKKKLKASSWWTNSSCAAVSFSRAPCQFSQRRGMMNQ